MTMKNNSYFFCLIIIIVFQISSDAQVSGSGAFHPAFAYLDTNLTLKERVSDLVSRMTITEKLSQLQNRASAIPRLGIAEYTWQNECLHGVVGNGFATVFPQVIGMAATWNPQLIHEEADVISTEARAKYYYSISKGDHGINRGITFWSPNINIVRDPRWGRGQETYGEDPYLTSCMGIAFVTGLQGSDPKYFKIISTPKHFAVHSGPEPERHEFDARISKEDLYNTYLPAFEACVKQGGAFSIMGAYSALDGVPDCASKFLLTDVLREKWGFKGYVVSDCGAIRDIYIGHRYAPDQVTAAAKALKAGCDLCCGKEYAYLTEAFNLGLISEKEIDSAVERLMLARFKLGMFDPAEAVPYSKISMNENDIQQHRELARKVADESIVLLKNADNTLPLKKNLKSVAVIGRYAENLDVLLGNYFGTPSNPVNIYQGIKNKLGKDSDVKYAQGYSLIEDTVKADSVLLMSEAVKLATNSDIVIVVAGIDPKLEGEEERDADFPGFKGGDRTTLNLPENQERLLNVLHETGKTIVLVLVGGSALAVNWEQENLPAIVDAWYPGEEGGNAVADVLFGDCNPSGKLPVTFYKSVKVLPPFNDYNMSEDSLGKGRTYRYFTGVPLYPFGFGLSYTKFEYSNLKVSREPVKSEDTLNIYVTIRNTGNYDGDEVMQIYVKSLMPIEHNPEKSLKGFKKVHIKKGGSSTVNLSIPVKSFQLYDGKENKYLVTPGNYELQVGPSSADIKLKSIIDVSK